jgi:hypothetical protein
MQEMPRRQGMPGFDHFMGGVGEPPKPLLVKLGFLEFDGDSVQKYVDAVNDKLSQGWKPVKSFEKQVEFYNEGDHAGYRVRGVVLFIYFEETER